MKSLILFPDDNHTGNHLNAGMIELGWESTHVCTNSRFNEILSEYDRIQPELIICCRGGHLYESLNQIREKNPQTTIYCWNTDSRFSLEEYAREFGQGLVSLFRLVDRVYNVAIGEVEYFKGEGIDSKWLVQGIGNENKPSIERGYKHDISFLGSIDLLHESQGGRISLLRGLYRAGYNLNLEPAYGDEACRVYYQSRINLGHAHSPHLGENSVRDFKIMGSGGFLLTQWFGGIEEIHNIGVEMDCYKTPEECLEKAKYYLEHEDEREMIAQTGYEACHDRHKYSDRLKTIIEDYKNESNHRSTRVSGQASSTID